MSSRPENLRDVGEKVGYTQEQLQEYERSGYDILHFANNYFHTVKGDEGFKIIELRKYQEKILKHLQDTDTELEKRYLEGKLDDDYVPKKRGRGRPKKDDFKRHTILMSGRQTGKCVSKETEIRIRNVRSKFVFDINIGTFFDDLSELNTTMSLGNRLNEKKFKQTIFLDPNNYEIWTDTGWEPITYVHKTVKYREYILKTETRELGAADDHIIIDAEFNEVFVKDLKPGQEILTETGIEKVVSVTETNSFKFMYDVTVKSEFSTFFTNGILSHNTTVYAIYALHYILFNERKQVAILADKEGQAMEILERIKDAYAELPKWMQQGITANGWSAKRIILENGSRIITASTKSTGIRGKTINKVILDEFAFVPPNIASSFLDSTLPAISSMKTSSVLISSTPKGFNHFYDIWADAERSDNDYKNLKVEWYEVPGRDEDFKRDIIRNKGEIHWAQEYACSFLGSSATLIDPEVLGKYNARKQFKAEYNGDLKVYQGPVKDAHYVLGVDPAKGVKKDYSVIQVLKINSVKDIEQVAVYRNNAIDYVKFSQIIMQVSENYNNAWCMIENNNEIGGQVTTMLHQVYGFEQMVHTSFDDIGIRADQKTKLMSNMLLKQYCEEGWIKLVDKDTIGELFLYEDKGRGTYGVDETIGNDDTVAGLRWGLYFIETDTLELGREALYAKDESLYLEMADETEMPIAIIDIGGEIMSTEDQNSFWDDVL